LRLAQVGELPTQERQQGLGHGLGSEAVELVGQVEGDLALCYSDSITRHGNLQIHSWAQRLLNQLTGALYQKGLAPGHPPREGRYQAQGRQ
jgi:hypothetical protein